MISEKVHLMKRLSLAILVSVSLQACESFLEVDLPTSQLPGEGVYEDEKTALGAISGVYHQMMYDNYGFASGLYGSVTLLSGLSCDELVNYSSTTSLVEFYENEMTPQSIGNSTIWSSCYEAIYLANAVMEGVASSSSLKDETKTQLQGEARFVRAFCHFYLVNLFGDVPVVRTTDYRVNKSIYRAPAAEVYASIVEDLVKAKELLSADYISVERVRPNKAAAAALLARTYLHMRDWKNAETQASIVISNTRYNLTANLNQVFLANRNECLWQMIHPTYTTFTNEGMLFILNGAPGSPVNPVALSSAVVASFEANDLRRTNWVGSYASPSGDTLYYPWKYKNNALGTSTSEYSMVLRLAEQFLIRAEARAKQGNLTGAIADLDVIRKRAQLPLIKDTNPSIGQDNLLLAIEQERKVELFAEWGHRWLDLKRTNRANTVLMAKPNWDETDILYPIPEQEILNNPNLKPQNPGYEF